MKTLLKILSICSLASFLMGANGCVTTDTVVVPEGPKAAELGKAKDEQIKGLVAQVKAEQEARQLEAANAAEAAAVLEGILFANEHVDPGLPRDAIFAEATFGKTLLPKATLEGIIRSKTRTIAVLEHDVAKTKELYGQATAKVDEAKAKIDAKNKEIADRDTELTKRDGDITQLKADAVIEKAAHAADVQAALDRKDLEIKKVKDDFASKERATWVLWTRIAGLAFIVIGAVIAIVFKVVPEGAAFVGVGVVIGLVSIFIDWLTSQPWFPWLCGGIILLILTVGGIALYRMWKQKTLHDKTVAALQDLKDEAQTLGHDTWDKVSEHLNYRLGDSTSFWGKAQAKAVAALGLVNPKAEAAIKAEVPPSVPPQS